MKTVRDIIFEHIGKERTRQDLLHPDNQLDEMLAVLLEEVGEVARAMQGEGNLNEELLHVAAVAVRWLEMLNTLGGYKPKTLDEMLKECTPENVNRGWDD